MAPYSLIPERREKVTLYGKALHGSIKRVNELNSRIHYLEKRKLMKQFISRAKKDAARIQADEDSINYIFNKLTRNTFNLEMAPISLKE